VLVQGDVAVARPLLDRREQTREGRDDGNLPLAGLGCVDLPVGAALPDADEASDGPSLLPAQPDVSAA
jgi:hypothetical protein